MCCLSDFQLIALGCYLTAGAWDPWGKHTAGTLPQVLSHNTESAFGGC